MKKLLFLILFNLLILNLIGCGKPAEITKKQTVPETQPEQTVTDDDSSSQIDELALELDSLTAKVNELESQMASLSDEDETTQAPDYYFSFKDFGAVGDGTTDDSNAISNAINAISSAGGDLYCESGTYKISSNLTIPSKVNLIISSGCILSPDDNVEIKIDGQLSASEYQIFNQTAIIKFGNFVSVVSPVWFGAIPDDGADDSISFQQAVKSIETGTVRIPSGTYELSTGIEITKSGFTIEGAGINSTFINYSGSETAFKVYDTNPSDNYTVLNIYFRSFYLTGNKDAKNGIHFFGVSVGEIKDIHVSNFSSSNGTDIQMSGHSPNTEKYFIAGSGYGIYLESSFLITVERCFIWANNIGLFLKSANSNTIGPWNEFAFNNKGDKNYPLVIYSNTGNVTVRENDFEVNYAEHRSDILLYGGILGVNVTGNRFEAFYSDYAIWSLNLGGIYFNNAINIENNYLTGRKCNDKAILFENTQYSTISGNEFYSFYLPDYPETETQTNLFNAVVHTVTNSSNISASGNYVYNSAWVYTKNDDSTYSWKSQVSDCSWHH